MACRILSFRARILFTQFPRFSSINADQISASNGSSADPDAYPIIEKRDLWKLDKFNKFQQIPQVWLSTMSCIQEKRVGLIDLHPDVFRTFPRYKDFTFDYVLGIHYFEHCRLDILHRNVTWQKNYRSIVRLRN